MQRKQHFKISNILGFSLLDRQRASGHVKFNMLKLILLLFFVSLFFYPASAAAQTTYYVREGASGGNNGSDWTNAYTSLPTTLVRGATYYIADGTYGAYTFDDAPAGSTLIYVKKATASDHGTSAGWQDSYGDGSAVFHSFTFMADYYWIDGQVGQWASDLPNYVPYGIIVRHSGGSNSKLLNFPPGSPGKYITLRHVEAYFTNTPLTGTWYTSMDVTYIYGGGNVTFEYCWFHDAGRVVLFPIGASNVTLSHSVIERNGQAQRAMGWNPAEHSEVAMFQPGSSNGIIRYSYIRDWYATGGVILYDNNTNMKFYGNVFTQTGNYTNANANGALNGLSAATNLSAEVYNNTFVDLNYGCNVLTMGSYTSRIIKNNIFYNCRIGSGGASLGGSHDYNWFYGSGIQSEPHGQNGSGDPFVNRAIKNYRLAVATYAGDSTIGSAYGVDPDGKSRGSDGTWDRGAFESGLGQRTEITPPSGLRVISQQ